MKRIRKLTPATLKRIIAEEKHKIMLQENRNTTDKSANSKKEVLKKMNESRKLKTYVRLLSLLKEQKLKKTNQANRIERLRYLIKHKIVKEL